MSFFKRLFGSKKSESTPNQNKEEQLILEVIDLSDEKEYDQALEKCEALISKYPEFSRTYFERGMIYLNQDIPDKAILDFKKTLDLEPNYPGAKKWYASAMADLGDVAGAAIIEYEQLKDEPEGDLGMGVSPNSWAGCAEKFWNTGDAEKAMAILKEYFELHESKVSHYRSYETAPMRLWIKILLANGKAAEALVLVEKAINSDHVVPADVLMQVRVYIENQRLADAKDILEVLIQEIYDGHITPEAQELMDRLNT